MRGCARSKRPVAPNYHTKPVLDQIGEGARGQQRELPPVTRDENA